ncbi:hypothetical protein ACJQWK_09262 [Exserohilum turcicum]
MGHITHAHPLAHPRAPSTRKPAHWWVRRPRQAPAQAPGTRTAPHRTALHSTAPHSTAPHRHRHRPRPRHRYRHHDLPIIISLTIAPSPVTVTTWPAPVCTFPRLPCHARHCQKVENVGLPSAMPCSALPCPARPWPSHTTRTGTPSGRSPHRPVASTVPTIPPSHPRPGNDIARVPISTSVIQCWLTAARRLRASHVPRPVPPARRTTPPSISLPGRPDCESSLLLKVSQLRSGTFSFFFTLPLLLPRSVSTSTSAVAMLIPRAGTALICQIAHPSNRCTSQLSA